MTKITTVLVLAVILISIFAVFINGAPIDLVDKREDSQTRENQAINGTPSSDIPAETVIATNLDTPWSIAFLPEGELLVTERSGTLSTVSNGQKTIIANIPSREIGEGGLMGVALDPDFEQNRFIYVQYTYSGQGDNTLNRVVRYMLQNDRLSDEKIIVDQIPGATNHNGGRIAFGPDGFLYITTGDAQEPSRAQDRNSLAGKILRVTKDGTPAPGNPFGTRVYSYGHRNPQGLAWDNQGKLYSTEHGRSGVLSGLDELNFIESGGNYGWPEIQGSETRSGMIAPITHSGSSTWAPAGTTFINGSIFFVGLRGSTLYEYKISSQEITEHLQNKYGRLRDAVKGPDNMLYITTSNRDGRGSPEQDDDKIIRINPSRL